MLNKTKRTQKIKPGNSYKAHLSPYRLAEIVTMTKCGCQVFGYDKWLWDKIPLEFQGGWNVVGLALSSGQKSGNY